MPEQPGRPRRRSTLALAAGLLVALGGLVGILANLGSQPNSQVTVTVTAAPSPVAAIDPHIAAGAHDFVQFACSQCHGEQGRGGIAPAVPALTSVAKTLTPAELRSIIDHGLGESADPTQPFMPVWGPIISATQVSDLIAYLRAGLPTVPTAEPAPIPRGQGDAVQGAALYVRYGCINCHGPNGLGGVPNPQSADKTIPPLAGPDFRKEFNTDEKILAVIPSGSVIGRPPIAACPTGAASSPTRNCAPSSLT